MEGYDTELIEVSEKHTDQCTRLPPCSLIASGCRGDVDVACSAVIMLLCSCCAPVNCLFRFQYRRTKRTKTSHIYHHDTGVPTPAASASAPLQTLHTPTAFDNSSVDVIDAGVDALQIHDDSKIHTHNPASIHDDDEDESIDVEDGLDGNGDLDAETEQEVRDILMESAVLIVENTILEQTR